MWQLCIVEIEKDGRMGAYIHIATNFLKINVRLYTPLIILIFFLCPIFFNSVALLVTMPALDL